MRDAIRGGRRPPTALNNLICQTCHDDVVEIAEENEIHDRDANLCDKNFSTGISSQL